MSISLRTVTIRAALLVVFATAASTKAGGTDDGVPEILPMFPTSPAFLALNANPTNILRPSTVRELGTDLLTAVTSDGKLKGGVALEVSPVWIIEGPTPLREWRSESNWKRILSGLTISFATLAQTDQGAVGLSEGLKLVIWDDFDPRWDVGLEQCIRKALQVRPEDFPDTEPSAVATAGPRPLPQAVRDELKKCYEDRQKARARGSGWSAALAGAVTQETEGPAHDLTWGKVFAWASVSRYWGGAAPRRDLELVLPSVRFARDIAKNRNEASVGARARLGLDTFGFAMEAAWTPNWSHDTVEWGPVVVASQADVRVAKDMWISLELGGHINGSSISGAGVFTNVKFKFGLGHEPVPIERPPQ